MKDEVRIYDKLDKKLLKNLLFLLILLKLTILKNEHYYFYTTTILHYQQHKNLLFSTISTKNLLCPHFLYKNLVFYITKLY